MKFIKIEDLKNLVQAYSPSAYMIKSGKGVGEIDGRLVASADEGSYVAEQYKVLRTNLYSLFNDKLPKTLVVTSSQPQEGKTVTSCNLAFTLSLDAEKKVLLIDTDFRRPAVHNIFGISRKPGFSDVLDGDADMEGMIKKPVIGNLFIVPAGTVKTSPSEIFSSTKIKNIIDKLKLKFDYVIFDTPPVLNVTDASILGSICDAVLFVVKAGVTQKNIIQEAFNMLAEAQAKPKACILTNVHFLLDAYSYFYKYKYYKYSDKK